MNIGLSYSLFGENEKYWTGIEKNYRKINSIYPEATMIVHTDDPKRVAQLCPKAAIFAHQTPADLGGTFWRFLSYNCADAVLFRDADSLINVRERAAVDEWLESGLGLHAMLDHASHTKSEWPVLAGMWGARKDSIPFDFNHLTFWWLANKGSFKYTSDQWYLRRYIWPLIVSGGGLLHSRYPAHKWGGLDWPKHPEYNSFVGSRI